MRFAENSRQFLERLEQKDPILARRYAEYKDKRGVKDLPTAKYAYIDLVHDETYRRIAAVLGTIDARERVVEDEEDWDIEFMCHELTPVWLGDTIGRRLGNSTGEKKRSESKDYTKRLERLGIRSPEDLARLYVDFLVFEKGIEGERQPTHGIDVFRYILSMAAGTGSMSLLTSKVFYTLSCKLLSIGGNTVDDTHQLADGLLPLFWNKAGTLVEITNRFSDKEYVSFLRDQYARLEKEGVLNLDEEMEDSLFLPPLQEIHHSVFLEVSTKLIASGRKDYDSEDFSKDVIEHPDFDVFLALKIGELCGVRDTEHRKRYFLGLGKEEQKAIIDCASNLEIAMRETRQDTDIEAFVEQLISKTDLEQSGEPSVDRESSQSLIRLYRELLKTTAEFFEKEAKKSPPTISRALREYTTPERFALHLFSLARKRKNVVFDYLYRE